MPFIPIPDTALFELVHTIHGQRVENTLYVTFPGGWTALSLASMGSTLIDWWGTEVLPYLSTDLSTILCKATDMSAQPSFFWEGDGTLPLYGLTGVQAFPNNVAGVVTFSAGLTGRSTRGRNYICGIPEDKGANSILSDTFTTAMVSAYSQLPDAIHTVDLGCDHVIASRYTAGAPRTTGVTYPVTAYTMDNVVDSQRRRLPGRGS